MNYTALAHAAKSVMNENIDAKKLLGLSQVIEKWISETFSRMN